MRYIIIAILAIAAAPAVAHAGAISGVTATGNTGFFTAVGMGWADTLWTDGVKLLFGPGLAIGSGIALLHWSIRSTPSV